jgi:transcriptional regulator with XRE-family HTH domain
MIEANFLYLRKQPFLSFSIFVFMALGGNIMLLRKEKYFSHTELSKLIGTSGDVVVRYERGDISPSIEVVAKIADALEVSIDYLIGKTKIEHDAEALRRLGGIADLSEENKKFVYHLIDMALRDFKTEKLTLSSDATVYSSDFQHISLQLSTLSCICQAELV